MNRGDIYMMRIGRLALFRPLAWLRPRGRLASLSLIACLGLLGPLAHAGEGQVLCLTATQPPVVSAPATTQIKMRLTDESAAGARRLIARVSITREVQHAHGLKLNPSLTALKDLTPARFREFCGATFTRDTEMGQQIELTWDLQDDTGLKAQTVLFERTQNLSVLTLAEAVNHFVKIVSAELDKRAGQVRGSAVHITPPTIADLKQDSPMAAALKVFAKGPDLERGPIAVIPQNFDDATIRKLVAGEALD